MKACDGLWKGEVVEVRDEIELCTFSRFRR